MRFYFQIQRVIGHIKPSSQRLSKRGVFSRLLLVFFFVNINWFVHTDEIGATSPMIPLSLLSSVELGLVIVPQGLVRLRGGRLVVLLSVEHGLSVLGDAVLLVSVEHGLMPWLAAEH